MSSFEKTARPYAKAAFEYAHEHKTLNEWQTFLTNAAMITDVTQIQWLLDHPSRKKKAVLDLFFSVLENEKPLLQTFKNFLILLISYDRITALNTIKNQFLSMRRELERTEDVRVVSMYELNEDQKRRVAKKLEKRFGKKINLTYHVDETLMGGAVIYVGDLVIDHSGRNQLEQLRQKLG